MSLRRSAQSFFAFFFLCGGIYAQSTTGTLFGIVSDSSDAPIPGAQVDVKNVATGAVTSTITGGEGIFRFNSLVPATYELTIKAAQGFKAYTQSGIDVTASEVRDLGKIALSIGTLTEQVSVIATTTAIQTASAENSKLIDSNR